MRELGEGETVDYLFWVGCAGATDDRATDCTGCAFAANLHREMLTLLIFTLLLVLILINLPIAVAIALTAIFFFVGLGEGSLLTMLPQRMYASTTGFTLINAPRTTMLKVTGAFIRAASEAAST